MTTNRDMKNDREETKKLILNPNRKKYEGGENWLGHGKRGGKDAFVDEMLIDGVTMGEMLKQRGAVYEHLGHLRVDHGLLYEKIGDLYRFCRSDLGISFNDVEEEKDQLRLVSNNLNKSASPEQQNSISINKQSIESLFSVGDIVPSGGGRRYFRLTEILDDRIRIQPTEASNGTRLHFQKISAVINNFHLIDPNRIEVSVYNLLERCGIKDTQNESYLYGFAKEFLARSQGKITERESETAKMRAVRRMVKTAKDTVAGANGQQVLQKVKEKENRFETDENFDKYVTDLLSAQEGLCAITGLVLQFDDQVDDQELLVSLDRIDSDGHYEPGNLQVVCRFVNRWKSDGNDAEFRRLMSLVRNSGAKMTAQQSAADGQAAVP